MDLYIKCSAGIKWMPCESATSNYLNNKESYYEF